MSTSRTRVCERRFLNKPGFHAGAYIRAEVENTARRKATQGGLDYNPAPGIVLEIADCHRRVDFAFDVDTAAGRANTLHKLDTMIRVLERFREGVAAELELYVERERASRSAPRRTKPTVDVKADYYVDEVVSEPAVLATA